MAETRAPRRILTSWKKKVALLAWRAAWESTGVAERKTSFWEARVGVADSFLMSYMTPC